MRFRHPLNGQAKSFDIEKYFHLGFLFILLRFNPKYFILIALTYAINYQY